MQKLLKTTALFLVVAMIAISLVGCDTSKTNGKIKIGIIEGSNASAFTELTEGFKEEMAKSDFDVEYIVKNGSGDTNLLASIAQQMLSVKVDIVFTEGTLASQITNTVVNGEIPIVFGGMTSPVDAGVVVDFENSTKLNITGVTDFTTGEGDLELIKEYLPTVKKVGTVYSSTEINMVVQYRTIQDVLEKAGYTFTPTVINNSSEISLALDKALVDNDVLIVYEDTTVGPAADLIAEKALAKSTPVIGSGVGQFESGFLMGRLIQYRYIGRVAAQKAIHILEGKKAYDVPLENAPLGDLYVNKTTANKLGIDVNIFKDATFVE